MTIVDSAVDNAVDRVSCVAPVSAIIVDSDVDNAVDRVSCVAPVSAIIAACAVDNAVDRELIESVIELKLILANAGVVVREDLSIPEGIAS